MGTSGQKAKQSRKVETSSSDSKFSDESDEQYQSASEEPLESRETKSRKENGSAIDVNASDNTATDSLLAASDNTSDNTSESMEAAFENSSGGPAQCLVLSISSSSSPEPSSSHPNVTEIKHHVSGQDSQSESEELEILSVQEFPQKEDGVNKRSTRASRRIKKKMRTNAFSPSLSVPSSTGNKSSISLVSSSHSNSSPEQGSNTIEALQPSSDEESDDSAIPPFAAGNVAEAVVLIDSDDESEIEESKPESRIGPRSAVSLLKSFDEKVTNVATGGINIDTVSMHDLVGASDLTETYQFNFSVDIEYFLTFLHPSFPAKKHRICFITGSPILKKHPLLKLFQEKFTISEDIAPLPHRYASHHSKMMINFFGNEETEIVIMTSNLTQLDFGGLNQSVWRSGRLKPGPTKTKQGNRFRTDLLRYMARYGISTTSHLQDRIKRLNFSRVEVELVASAPGTYDLKDESLNSEKYGFAKLRQVLKRNDLLIGSNESRHNIASQVTSIASPYLCQKGQASSVFSHLLCPLMFKDMQQLSPGAESFIGHQKEFNYKPHYVFPRTKDIARSSFGYLSGTAVHFNYTDTGPQKCQYQQNVKDYLYKWNTSGNVTGREHLTPHSKYYVCDNGDNWKTLKWVLVGSHNLSKQAWGYPVAKTNGAKYDVSSYELSVLIPGPLIPTYKSDFSKDGKLAPIRLPFLLPPEKYSADDRPWSTSADCGTRKDRYGNTYRGFS